jgi:hypothetical protein
MADRFLREEHALAAERHPVIAAGKGRGVHEEAG